MTISGSSQELLILAEKKEAVMLSKDVGGFTESAYTAALFAEEEARGLPHGYIGTEHLLLGLIRADKGIAAKALASLDITLDKVREQIVAAVETGLEEPHGNLVFTPRATKVVKLAGELARQLNYGYVRTEDVLLALIQEAEQASDDHQGLAATILIRLAGSLEAVRTAVLVFVLAPS